MTKIHPLLDGVNAVCASARELRHRHQLFEQVYDRVRINWISNRAGERWPSQANWLLRTAPEFTQHPTHYLEKQLQKNIAIALQDDGWGNDVPTASEIIVAGR